MEENIKRSENHPSIKLIKDNVLSEDKDLIIEPTTLLLRKLIILNSKKVTGLDKVLLKIKKLAATIIDSHLTNINNNLPKLVFQLC